MALALKKAEQARLKGEVPVGALIVRNDQIISSAFNLREAQQRPTAHAELLAIESASQILGSWRLTGCSLYVTLEPCLMCAGAIVNSRVPRVVFGARDPKAGAVVSLYEALKDRRLNHRPEIVEGVLALESAQILKDFFGELRQNKGPGPHLS